MKCLAKTLPGLLIIIALQLFFFSSAEAVEITVKGRVVDEIGTPLSSVSVIAKHAKKGTTTDENGNYLIKVEDSAVLIFEHIGFEIVEIAVVGHTEVNVTLVSVKQGISYSGSQRPKIKNGHFKNIYVW